MCPSEVAAFSCPDTLPRDKLVHAAQCQPHYDHRRHAGANGIPLVIAEQNRELVEELRRRQVPAVSGDASDPAVLIQAHIARASVLVVAIPDAAGVRKMVETAKTLNPKVEILLRTHNDEEAELLRREDLGLVFMGEHELAQAMTREASWG